MPEPTAEESRAHREEAEAAISSLGPIHGRLLAEGSIGSAEIIMDVANLLRAALVRAEKAETEVVAMRNDGSWFKESDIDRLMAERDALRAAAQLGLDMARVNGLRITAETIADALANGGVQPDTDEREAMVKVMRGGLSVGAAGDYAKADALIAAGWRRPTTGEKP